MVRVAFETIRSLLSYDVSDGLMVVLPTMSTVALPNTSKVRVLAMVVVLRVKVCWLAAGKPAQCTFVTAPVMPPSARISGYTPEPRV